MERIEMFREGLQKMLNDRLEFVRFSSDGPNKEFVRFLNFGEGGFMFDLPNEQMPKEQRERFESMAPKYLEKIIRWSPQSLVVSEKSGYRFPRYFRTGREAYMASSYFRRGREDKYYQVCFEDYEVDRAAEFADWVFREVFLLEKCSIHTNYPGDKAVFSEGFNLWKTFNRGKEKSQKDAQSKIIFYLLSPFILLFIVVLKLCSSMLENPLLGTIFFILNILLFSFPQLSGFDIGGAAFLLGFFFLIALIYSIYLTYLRYFKGIKFSFNSDEDEWRMQCRGGRFSELMSDLYFWWILGVTMAFITYFFYIWSLLLKFF